MIILLYSVVVLYVCNMKKKVFNTNKYCSHHILLHTNFVVSFRYFFEIYIHEYTGFLCIEFVKHFKTTNEKQKKRRETKNWETNYINPLDMMMNFVSSFCLALGFNTYITDWLLNKRKWYFYFVISYNFYCK